LERQFKSFRDAAMPVSAVEERDGLLIIHLTQSILVKEDVTRFTHLLWESVERAGEDITLVINFSGEHRLSSLGIGAVIGMINRVGKIRILNPSPFMHSIFKRFRFDEMGVGLAKTLDECY